MEKSDNKHIFGPVPSRRLGYSLGIDPVPFKTCTYDCIYCQLGRTTCRTLERKEWVPPEEIAEELKRRLEEKVRIDFITLSGSGEPLLNSGVGEIVSRIKKMTDIPLAVLTNGSLLAVPEVRRSIAPADLVIPSLDAGSGDVFYAVNRPHEDLSFEAFTEGIVRFSGEYSGSLWLEVFLLDGITSGEEEARRIGRIVERIRPEKVQLNTVDRPPAESFARPVSAERMKELAPLIFGNAEIIGNFRPRAGEPLFEPKEEAIVNLLGRRPCSLEDIAGGLSLHPAEALKYLGKLKKSGRLTVYMRGGTAYYGVSKQRP